MKALQSFSNVIKKMTDKNDLNAIGLRQKVGRLKREIKQHKQNCWKRQYKMLQLQEVIFKKI